VGHFVPGIELNRQFYEEAVAPIVRRWDHSAALLGWGSEILGFDTSRSTDHGWGPRLQVFVTAQDVAAVNTTLEEELPEDFRGFPTHYGWDDTPVQHHVRVEPLGVWLEQQLGFDPRLHLDYTDWLLTPQQQLLGVVAGAVYHDPKGELGALRQQLRWYPDQVWLWMLACGWKRITQEEAFVGRTAEVGDETGSRLIAARLIRDLMQLCFLLSRQYWPYAKWFGSAFAKLDVNCDLSEVFARVVAATDHQEREQSLVEAYERVTDRHNAVGITAPVDAAPREFYGRGFRVLMADRFVDACLAEVSDQWLQDQPLVGSVDQFVDSTDALHVKNARRLRSIYTSRRRTDPPTSR
jgi:Domain of unknown function (DUF4037)